LAQSLHPNFEILNKFKTVKVNVPIMSYATCIDLEILIKEMMDYEIPSDAMEETCMVGKDKMPRPRKQQMISSCHPSYQT
jgi:hypothetical protein